MEYPTSSRNLSTLQSQANLAGQANLTPGSWPQAATNQPPGPFTTLTGRISSMHEQALHLLQVSYEISARFAGHPTEAAGEKLVQSFEETTLPEQIARIQAILVGVENNLDRARSII